MRDRVTVLAPAKLNLALDVVGILPGGYHALDMTMQAISLYERVIIRRSPYLDLTLPGSNVKPGPGKRLLYAFPEDGEVVGVYADADHFQGFRLGALLQIPVHCRGLSVAMGATTVVMAQREMGRRLSCSRSDM